MNTVTLSPETVWKAALGELEMQMTRATFTTWLQGTRALAWADGALLARAHVLWVFVDLATGRPRRIPAAFLSAFAANVAE